MHKIMAGQKKKLRYSKETPWLSEFYLGLIGIRNCDQKTSTCMYMKWLWFSPFALASAFSAEAWWWWWRTVSFRWFGWITWLKDELPTSFRAIVVISDLPTQFESPIVPAEVDWDCCSCCCDGGAAAQWFQISKTRQK